MKNALFERLEAARQRLFVGRHAEMEFWQVALQRTDQQTSWPISVWYVHGLGGIGKTSLLRQWKHKAQQANLRVVTLDARDIAPTVSLFCEALREALEQELEISIPSPATPATLCKIIENSQARFVLQIDTYELLEPLDSWLREKFLLHWPENAVLTLAGRNPLPLAWHEAAWREQVREFDLPALSPEEGQDYLQQRGVAVESQAHFIEWTHGHPLALSLAADVWTQHQEKTPKTDVDDFNETFSPARWPQFVGALLSHLVREIPSAQHRAALEASAVVRVLNEELLGVLLGDQTTDVGALFAWLRRSSLMQNDRFGIFPHDLAREALVADLRWRNPAWHGELHDRARNYYLRRIRFATGNEQQRAISDCLFLHRMSPVVAPYLQWNDSHCCLENARRDDWERLLGFVERHEGKAARKIAARWFELQPEGLVVTRDEQGRAQGFVFQLALHRLTAADIAADPGALAVWEFLKRSAPLRKNENATIIRFWMDGQTYQQVSSTQSLIFVQAVRYYVSTPDLAYSFFACDQPDFWKDGFLYADFKRVEADFWIGKHQFGVFGHDWRERPIADWFDLLSKREMHSVALSPTPPLEESPESPTAHLTEEVFRDAVRLALRYWNDSEQLRRNMLLQSAVVRRRARQIAAQNTPQESRPPEMGFSSEERIVALRSLLRQAVGNVAQSPRQEKPLRSLELVFGRRFLSQESAASAMNVSHSSFRRYLRTALNLVGEWLWERENNRSLMQGTEFISQNGENDQYLNLF